MRLKHEQLEMLKEKFDTEKIWSFSRLSTYLQEPWEYRMTYLEKVGRGQSIYGYLGGVCHDIIQDMYDGLHTYEEMSEKFDDAIREWKLNHSDLKFISQNVEDNYIQSVSDYFKTTEVIPYEIKNETPVCIVLKSKTTGKNIVFVGYIDSEYTDEDGIFNIVDYKTSSISGFSGKALKEKAQQLTLYAYGINQVRGIPFEKIRLRFDMMKYYEIHFLQKNGKVGKTKAERNKWVAKLTKKLQKDLFDLDYDPLEIDDILEQCLLDNSIESLPQEIQDKYSLHNCYIDVTVTEEEANELMDTFVEAVDEVVEKEKGNWEVEFPEPAIDAKNEFYFTQLASHLLPYHKKYQEQKQLQIGVANDDDLLAMFE